MNKRVLLSLFTILSTSFNSVKNDRSVTDDKNSFSISYRYDLYQKIQSNDLSFEVFDYALAGFTKLQEEKMLNNDTLLTIIDYSKPSSKERLFIIDLKNCRIHIKTLVAHGQATGDLYSRYFSNRPQSHQSSLGFFITDKTYYGSQGYSLRLIGIEKDINDNAEKRAIVFHGADYVSYNYLHDYGRLGRSFGCPALPIEKNRKIIDLIKNKSCVFIYYPAKEYLDNSSLITTNQFLQTIAE
jgi:hypothetical protein